MSTQDRDGTFVLEVVWDEGAKHLPPWIGPFRSKDEAVEWAGLNVPNGRWAAHPLRRPYA